VVESIFIFVLFSQAMLLFNMILLIMVTVILAVINLYMVKETFVAGTVVPDNEYTKLFFEENYVKDSWKGCGGRLWVGSSDDDDVNQVNKKIAELLSNTYGFGYSNLYKQGSHAVQIFKPAQIESLIDNLPKYATSMDLVMFEILNFVIFNAYAKGKINIEGSDMVKCNKSYGCCTGSNCCTDSTCYCKEKNDRCLYYFNTTDANVLYTEELPNIFRSLILYLSYHKYIRGNNTIDGRIGTILGKLVNSATRFFPETVTTVTDQTLEDLENQIIDYIIPRMELRDMYIELLSDTVQKPLKYDLYFDMSVPTIDLTKHLSLQDLLKEYAFAHKTLKDDIESQIENLTINTSDNSFYQCDIDYTDKGPTLTFPRSEKFREAFIYVYNLYKTKFSERMIDVFGST
jgi:hypothetical protein